MLIKKKKQVVEMNVVKIQVVNIFSRIQAVKINVVLIQFMEIGAVKFNASKNSWSTYIQFWKLSQ